MSGAMAAPSLILYTKKKCPLCEEGKAALELACEAFGYTFNEKDIYEDDQLLETYQLLIPAIELNGQLIATGRIEMKALKEIFTIENT